MVKITRNYLIRHSDGLSVMHKRHKNDSDKDYLERITHLKLQGRYIDAIDKLEDCVNVKIAYFQNNLLTTIHNMDCFPNITHLYLQRNKISKIENLSNLVHLKKLYLGHNEILVLEGLDSLTTLREVHVEYQNLPLGESMHFDPRTITNLSTCLEILNVSGDGLLTLGELSGLFSLKELVACENHLVDLADLADTLLDLPSLDRMVLTKNPVASYRDYRDTIIVTAKNLRWLDDKEVTSTTRQFVEGWQGARVSRMRLKSRGATGEPACQPSASRKIVQFTDFVKPKKPSHGQPLMFPSWKLRDNISGVKNGTFIPRAYRSRSSVRQ